MRIRKVSAMAAAGLIGLTALLVGSTPAHASVTTYISVSEPDGASIGPMVIDMTGASKVDRGRAQLWLLRTPVPSNQRWTITEIPAAIGPAYQIKNLNSGKCLDKSQDYPDANGNVVWQTTCHHLDVNNSDSDNQSWLFVQIGSSKWGELENASDQRCLDATGYAYSNGTPLQVWDCNATWNQRWNIS
jgi:hypothetical protein